MQSLPLNQAFTLIEPGPVLLISTHDGGRDNLMTLSWSMVLNFTPRLAISTGPWNHSYQALRAQRECVLAVPGADLLDTVVGIGTCSGSEVDKFARFGLTRRPAQHVRAPLIEECLAHIECRVVELLDRHPIIVLDGLAAHVNPARREQRTLHAVGDGRFRVDGRTLERRQMMANKLPPGV